ncbi:MAG: hypothetical protein QW263_04460 [Nitrososphaerota archaeon]
MEVRVRTGTRLHMGFTSSAEDVRPWSGIGLAIEEPPVEVRAFSSDRLEVVGEAEHRRVILRALGMMGLEGLTARIEVKAPDLHVGLGTTTQLTLAACTAVLALSGRHVDPIEVARVTGRGQRSWIGIAAFARGGFVVDLGRRRDGWHHDFLTLPFPEEWATIVCIPRGARGPDEAEEAFRLESFRLDPESVRELRSLVLGLVVPGLMGRDFEEFCRGIEMVQHTVGDAFSHLQGGRFNVRSSEAVDALFSAGAAGVGQSSWGPTVYGFAPSSAEALRISRSVMEQLGHRWSVLVTRGRNRGAEVHQRN